jgi:hypothetical protein
MNRVLQVKKRKGYKGDSVRGRGAMKILMGTILTAGLFFSPPAAGRPGNQAEETKTSELRRILDLGAAYCDKLNGAVLNFVCRERIQENVAEVNPRQGVVAIAASGGTYTVRSMPVLFGRDKRQKLVYDYQLIHDRDGRLTETRTLLEEDGKTVSVPNAPLKTRVFEHKCVVLGPIGLLGRDQQDGFDYELVKETKYRREPVDVIKTVPKTENTANRLFGTIWARKSDGAVMKIEWEQASLGNYQQALEIAKFLGAEPKIEFASEYEFEKNGLLFPSRYSIKETYHKRGARAARRSLTVVDYDNYKFFTVETGVIYK